MGQSIHVHPVVIPIDPSQPTSPPRSPSTTADAAAGATPASDAATPRATPASNAAASATPTPASNAATPRATPASNATAGATPTPASDAATPGAYTLAGSLFVPDGADAQHQHPGVAILGGPGPGPLARSTASGDRQWPMIWAHELAEAGFVAICYDQRGSGQSTGRYSDADRTDLYHDAEAVLELLATQPEVNAHALAVVAWDEGCGFALELAQAGQVQALVLLAPPFYTARERFTRDIRRLAASRGLSERVVQLRLKLWQEQLERLAQQVEKGEPTATVDVGDQKAQINLARFLQNARFDPAAVLPHVDVPMLILHGEDDKAIPPEESAQLAQVAQAKGEQIAQRHTYVEAGHFLYSDRRVRRDAIAWLQDNLGHAALEPGQTSAD